MQGQGSLLSKFEGVWRLDREINDRRAGQTPRFDGEAVFTPQDNGLLYQETGLLRLPGAPPMPASRSYMWRDAGKRIAVFFADGRPFHEFDPTIGQARADHWCDPDIYRVSYDFAAWPHWACRWSVTGPRKDYTLESHYSRG